MKRFFAALGFAFKAFRAKWRFRDLAVLQVVTKVQRVSPTSGGPALLEPLPALTAATFASPPPAPTPDQTAPELESVKVASKPVVPPFFVMSQERGVLYTGDSGAEARKTIEGLRTTGERWTALRDGKEWDWGPR